MRIYVDLETLQLIEGPGFRNPVNSLRFKRGDAARLDVTFLANGTTPVQIGDPATLELRFGAKPRARYDVAYLVHTSTWTLPDPGAESPAYQCSPSFNTVQLDSAMQVGSAAGSELAEITLMGEITWREGINEPTSTRTFSVIVENDVNRGTEGIPDDANPPYPAPELLLLQSNVDWLADKAVRYDAPQPQLDQAGRNQFFANFGATLAEELPGPALRSIQLLDPNDIPWLTYYPGQNEAGFSMSLLTATKISAESLYDSVPSQAIHLDNRELIGPYGNLCAMWSGSTFAVLMPDLTVAGVATDMIMNSGYNGIIDVANRQLLGSSGLPILEWDDTYGFFTGDLATSGGLYAGELLEYNSGLPAIDLNYRQLQDNTGQPVLDWNYNEIYLNQNMVSGPFSFVSDVFANYNGGTYLYGITDEIDLITATSITVSGGIITGYN